MTKTFACIAQCVALVAITPVLNSAILTPSLDCLPPSWFCSAAFNRGFTPQGSPDASSSALLLPTQLFPVLAAKAGGRATSAALPPPVITALSPKPEDCSSHTECIVRAEGTWTEPNTRQGIKLAVVVRPLPARGDQSYWVQGTPVVDEGGSWYAKPVYIGQPGDWEGMPFTVCVVATALELEMGDRLTGPPTGPIFCLEVTRGRKKEKSRR